MFVHCHNCGWEQDDFYSINGYNPTSFLASLNEDLCGNRLDDIVHCGEFVNGIPIRSDITKREWIARYYEQFARHIREMKWVTAERFYADPDKVCPKCGSDKLDLD
jgi:hypothetical protein